MRQNGSVYVSAVFLALAGYFVYQWWFNPNRIVKARLGAIAETLSVPPHEPSIARLTRLARLRTLATVDLHVRIGRSGPDLASRDAVLGALGALAPSPEGWNVDFVDSDVRVDREDTARAFVTAEVSTRDQATGQQSLDSRDVTLSFVKQDGEWLVRDAEVRDLPAAK